MEDECEHTSVHTEYGIVNDGGKIEEYLVLTCLQCKVDVTLTPESDKAFSYWKPFAANAPFVIKSEIDSIESQLNTLRMKRAALVKACLHSNAVVTHIEEVFDDSYSFNSVVAHCPDCKWRCEFDNYKNSADFVHWMSRVNRPKVKVDGRPPYKVYPTDE